MKRIGITITAKTEDLLWSNGINQNAIYLGLLLSKLNHSIYFICSDIETKNVLTNLNLKVSIVTFSETQNIPFNIIIQLGFAISEVNFDKLKTNNKKVKLINYKCGNELILDMELILFDNKRDTINRGFNHGLAKPDEIWVIPQMEKTNIYYYSYLNKQDNATVVPFIWNPYLIEKSKEAYNLDLYSKSQNINVGILEPNLSVMKNLLIPIAIIDTEYSKYKNINSVIMFSSQHMKDNKYFIKYIKQTELSNDKIIKTAARYKTADILKKHANLIVSWQWENNLNYLYFDVAWLGYPVVHNASLCQDVGYYYEDFNIMDGQNKLHKAILNHHDDINYLNRNRENIMRYTDQNDKMVEQYDMLINNVLNNKFIKYNYNWKTNLLE